MPQLDFQNTLETVNTSHLIEILRQHPVRTLMLTASTQPSWVLSETHLVPTNRKYQTHQAGPQPSLSMSQGAPSQQLASRTR